MHVPLGLPKKNNWGPKLTKWQCHQQADQLSFVHFSSNVFHLHCKKIPKSCNPYHFYLGNLPNITFTQIVCMYMYRVVQYRKCCRAVDDSGAQLNEIMAYCGFNEQWLYASICRISISFSYFTGKHLIVEDCIIKPS